MAEADDAARIRKLIVQGDNRLKHGGRDGYARARSSFERARELADRAGLGERFEPFLRVRLESIERLETSDRLDSEA